MFSRKVSNPSSKSATESSSHSSTPTSTPSLEGPSTPTFEKSGTASSVQTPSSVSFVSGMTESTATASGYSRKQALDDLPMIRNVLHTFLSGKMVEAEAQIKDADLNNERLYTTSGWGVIQCLKSLMSFEEDEIDAALEATKHAAFVAGHHRRPATSLTARLAGLVVGSAQTSGVGFVKGMTAVERHAELVYAECLLEKAILGIASSGDWLTFIKEFLNIRSATNIYRTLGQFIQTMDAEAVARGEGPIDKSIDLDFRSGVALGNGVNSLVLTMLPDSVSGVVALFGYKGDRIDGLRTLSTPGGWQDGITDPSITQENEGLRRPITDLMLLVFHLYLSAVTYLGVSIPQARNILNYNLKLYPDGVFFLFLQGRLRIIESQPELAIESFTKGMQLTQYETLKNVAIWEMAVAKLTLCDWSPDLWKRLLDESNWSKAVYSYGLAACLHETGGDKNKEEAAALFEKTPSLLKRLAGKSIPMEKFVSRKSRKFESQGNRLFLPGVELCYMFSSLNHTPRRVLLSKTIPLIEESLKSIESSDPSNYGNGTGYWDDLCLGKLLLGVCLRYVAYPDPQAVEDPSEDLKIDVEATRKKAFEALKFVYSNGTKIELDHYLVYCAHYELGKLYARTGDITKARHELELVASGKPLEVNASGRKGGKYSLENALHVRTHAALEALDSGDLL